MDRLTPEKRSRLMAAIRGKNTKPEMVVRRLLHAMGYRFRLHRHDLPGCPDLVFYGLHAVIEVRGCFWHQHTGCRYATTPVTRPDYWIPKLARNVERDRENTVQLRSMGWRVAVVWECRLRSDAEREVRRLDRFLSRARKPRLRAR